MDTRKIQKGYSHLSINERFSLLVQANQRGDEIEAQALKSSDPKKTFTVSSLQGLIEGFHFLTVFYVMQQLSNVAMYYQGLINFENITIMLESAEKFNNRLMELKADILTYSEAYKAICGEYGVDPELMLSPYKAQTLQIRILVSTLQAINIDKPLELPGLQSAVEAFRWTIEDQRKKWE